MINKKKNIFNLFVNYFKIYKHLSKLRKFQLVMLSFLTVVLTFTELLSLATIIPLINIFTNSNSLVNNQFIEIILSITNLLNPDNGIFVTESHYAVNILNEMQFDSIYHEHLRFYLLKPLIFLLNKYGFNVIDASRIPNYI